MFMYNQLNSLPVFSPVDTKERLNKSKIALFPSETSPV